MTPAEYEMADELRWDRLVLDVADRLRSECQQIFGSTWDNDVSRKFAKVALLEIEKKFKIVPL
jgi:hypothetical protein